MSFDTRTGRVTRNRNIDRFERSRQGAFGEQIVSTRYPQIELNASFPLSAFRDDTRLVGSGAINDGGVGEYELVHAAGGDTAFLTSQQRGRYVPGFEAEAGLGVRMAGEITDPSSVAEWGYFDAEPGKPIVVRNGLLFGWDIDGLYVRIVRSGTEIFKEYQNDWFTGIDYIKPGDNKGRIYQIPFSYYGYGAVFWQIVTAFTGDNFQIPILVNSFAPENDTTLENPNLKIGAYVQSSGGSDAFRIYVGGRKFHTKGQFIPLERFASAPVYGVTTQTAFAPMVSVRRKTGYRSITIGPASFSALVRQQRIAVRIIVNASLSGASWGALPGIPTDETALEMDTAASSYSGGIKVYETVLPSGQGVSSVGQSIEEAGLDLPDDAVLTLAARTLTGSTGEGDFVLRVREEW